MVAAKGQVIILWIMWWKCVDRVGIVRPNKVEELNFVSGPDSVTYFPPKCSNMKIIYITLRAEMQLVGWRIQNVNDQIHVLANPNQGGSHLSS